jgi:trimethylamine:corrinoid methyltransferase-like protein
LNNLSEPGSFFTPLRLRREALIGSDQAARVHELAKQVLSEIGMEVRDPAYRARLVQAGLKESGERIFFEPAMVDVYVDEVRHRLAAERPAAPRVDDGRLTLSVSSYSLFVHDLESGQVVPYTTERLVEMTKLIDSLADEGVFGAPPGIPVDISPDLQPLAQYRIAAFHARQGATPVDPTSVKTAPYLFEMADVMGSPVTSLPVYIPTPLRLGGESLEVVMGNLERLDNIGISSMPAAGMSAPIHPFGALALAAAEVIGGMIAVRILTGKPVDFYVNIFPSDLREGSMVFGSPENMLYQMLSVDMNRFYGHHPADGPDNIHVMAKLPDSQSAAEKSAIMALGASMGVRHFSCAGTLSLDEIFSAEQLLADCETRNWVQRALQGVWMGEEAVEDWLGEIRAGMQGGFLALDSTLGTYQRHVWYPKWFQRAAIGSWMEHGQPRLGERLRAEVRRRIAAHNFELDAYRRQEIERIYERASRVAEE